MDEEQVRTDEETTQEDRPQTKAEKKAQKKAEKRAQSAGGEAPVATEDEWREALETAVRQRDEYLQMAQRAQADYQNFKRRNAQTRTDSYEEAVREVLGAMLPVIDNLDRALSAAEQTHDLAALVEGVQMTRRLLLDNAGRYGLEEVPAMGEVFDPEKHNAVMRSDEGEPGTVLEVFEKGYRVKDRMIRYAMVRVAAD